MIAFIPDSTVLAPGAIALDDIAKYNFWLIFISYLLAVSGSYMAISVLKTLPNVQGGVKKTGIVLGSAVMAMAIWSMHYTGMLSYNMRMEHHYDPWITLLSGVVALFFALSVFLLLTRKTFDYRHIIFSAPLLGAGVASMHYTGMSAMRMQADIYYKPGLFYLSIAIAVIASGAALWIMHRVSGLKRYQVTAKIAASMLLGIAVCGMHYTGMAATVIVPYADCRFDAEQNFIELTAAVVFAACLLMGLAVYFLLYVRQLQEGRQVRVEFDFLTNLQYATLALIFMLISATGFFSYHVYFQLQETLARESRDNELYSDILYLSEVSTMAVRMASATGDPKWEERHRQHFPLLSEAIREAKERYPIDYQSVGVKIDDASNQLEAMEQEALAFSRKGKLKEATAIMDSAKYAQQESIYQRGMKDFLNILADKAEDQINHAISEIYFLMFMILPGITALLIGIAGLKHGRKLLARTIQERNLTQNIMDAIPDPIFVKDSEHVWKAGNKSFWNLMGGAPENFIGKNDHDIFPPEEVAVFWEKDDKVIRTGIVDVNEESVTGHDGKSMTALTTKSPLVLPDGKRGLVGIIHNITALKNAEKELSQHRDNLQKMVEEQTRHLEEEKLTVTLLQNVATIANEVRRLQSALHPILMLICRYIGWPVGHAYIYSEEDKTFVSSKTWYLEKEADFAAFKRYSEELHFTAGVGIPGKALQQKKAQWVTDLDNHQFPRREIMLSSSFKTALAFPIVENGRVAAILEFFTPSFIPANGEILHLFDNIGSQLSVVLERERTEKMMLKAVAEAERANKLKSEFLANMSHELRTPMHSIITFSRQGIERKDRWSKDEQAENLALIKESGERLLKLLNDLLDLSKLESGAMTYEFSPVDMKGIVSNVSRQLQSLIDEKKLSLQFTSADNLPKAYCDEGKMMQVILNLLSNAIKFTPEGKSIQVSCALDTKDSTMLHLQVSDEGIGIPPDELKSVFDKFIQSSKTKSGAGGTGLGLTICKEIVVAHRGNIWAENNAHGGTCFHVLIPIQPTINARI